MFSKIFFLSVLHDQTSDSGVPLMCVSIIHHGAFVSH